jgi:hypothetical protein
LEIKSLELLEFEIINDNGSGIKEVEADIKESLQ